jgi:acyl-CoA reductase-like NAD-dependent aldehyde dehydrogenase
MQTSIRPLAKFQTALEALKPGDPMDETTSLAPLSTEAALLKLLDQVERAAAAGATIVMGGKRVELSSMGIQEFVNKKLVRVASIDAPA